GLLRPVILRALNRQQVMNKERGGDIAAPEQPTQVTRVLHWKVACIQVGRSRRCLRRWRSAEPKSMLPDRGNERARTWFRGAHNFSAARARGEESMHHFLIERVVLLVAFSPMVLDIAHDIACDGGRKKPGTSDRPQQGRHI